MIEMDANRNGLWEYAEWDQGGNGSREWQAYSAYGNEQWDTWQRIPSTSAIDSTMTVGGGVGSVDLNGIVGTAVVGSSAYTTGSMANSLLAFAAYGATTFARSDIDGDGWYACRPGETPVDGCDTNDNRPGP
jgi:hypothetical protein